MVEKTLLEVFTEHLGHLSFDEKLAKKMKQLQMGFVNKNKDYMTFFGGNLTGVEVIRFTPNDSSALLDDVLGLDTYQVEQDIHHHVKDIVSTRNVSADVFNLTCMYLIHGFMKAGVIEGARSVGLYLHYKYLCARLSTHFKYPCDPKLAQATYMNMSARFLLKKLGSWQKVLEYRVNETISETGLHHQYLMAFGPDLKIAYAITNSYGMISEMIKDIFNETVIAQKEGDRVGTISATVIDADGAEVLKDKVHGCEEFTSYLLGVVNDERSFIKEELVAVIGKLMHTMQVRGFRETLSWISQHVGHPEHKEVEELIKLTIVHAFNFLLENEISVKQCHDLSLILMKMKGTYVSSRSADEDLLRMREIGTKVVTKALGKTNEQALAAIRTGVFLYFCLRAFTKRFYVQ